MALFLEHICQEIYLEIDKDLFSTDSIKKLTLMAVRDQRTIHFQSLADPKYEMLSIGLSTVESTFYIGMLLKVLSVVDSTFKKRSVINSAVS